MERYSSREKNSKLREWIIILTIKDWDEITSVVDANLIYISPVSRIALENIIKHHKKIKALVLSNKRGKEFDFNNFKKITKQNINTKDWGNIKSEIPKACLLNKKIQIIKKDHLPSHLDIQDFFLQNRMEKNLSSINNVNNKYINEFKVDNSFQSADLARCILLQLHDINYKNNRKEIIKGKKKVTLDNYQDAIELFYHENKLKILCFKVNRAKFHNNHHFTDEEMIWDELVPEKYLVFPQISIYAKTYYMMRNKCEKTFLEIKDLLSDEEILKKLSTKYLSEIYRYLMGFCISQINDGKEEYSDQFLDFIQILAQDHLLLQQGKFPIWSFKNIVKMAIKSKRFEWADNFILTEKDKIDIKERAAIVEYSMALVNYRHGHFKKAYDLINYQPLSKDPFIRIDTLILLLHIYLDYDPSDSFYNRRNNLRGMMNSQTGISDSIMVKWKLTLNRIGKVHDAFDKTSLMKIRTEIKQDIEDGRFYPGRDWMLDFLNR